ncbi:hypothetical protein NADFUDRAFT_78614 [Nadsonia fulvescens var. elongata DSM 6958]|uniref:Pre-mRNA-splicing factor CWC26 n=1 Tax=Nadsonia fulvescens var. elongata DSM 6958 TaxID=857566 RepID=A0A1E3PKI7_9ASCO|nr:hypothetical protein NADFUDRAFT_78614 [Nadsonia fulvescens var. elongata DSM 6958]
MDPNDEEVPTIVGDIYQETLPSTKKANKSSGWKRLGSTALIAKIRSPQSNNKNNNENDSLLYEDTVPKMNNGSRAGLQTAKQVLEAISLKEKKELQAMEEFMNQSAAIETIYRDASGQKVDIEQKRAEEEQKVREKETRLRKQKVMNQGLVQQLEASKRRREIEEAHNDESGGHKMSITVNDTSRNDELKQKTRYNDPAAMFSKKENDTKKSLTGLLLYQGSFPPNRFGIVPGHRWDGVDRSNGFETLWYKKQNERNAMKSLSYSMEFDE